MLYLASKSPRRSELLAQAGVEFCFLENFIEADELVPGDCFFSELALRNAVKKAEVNIENLPNGRDYLLSCDTVVELKGEILGKPEDIEDARKMLAKMAGNIHCVASAVCIMNKNGSEKIIFVDTADVKFNGVNNKFIDNYLENVHVIDKAGSYALQHHLTQQLVANVSGDPSTVIGLPMKKLLRSLEILNLF